MRYSYTGISAKTRIITILIILPLFSMTATSRRQTIVEAKSKGSIDPSGRGTADRFSEIRSTIKSKGQFGAAKNLANNVFARFRIGAANGT